MELSDIPNLGSLEEQIFDDPWPREIFEELLEKAGTNALVVLAESGLVGYAVLEVTPEYAHLTNIAVARDYRRKSVAKLLMDRIFEIVTERLSEIIILEVRPSSSPAISLYKKYGFNELYRQPNYYRQPVEEAIVMAAYPNLENN